MLDCVRCGCPTNKTMLILQHARSHSSSWSSMSCSSWVGHRCVCSQWEKCATVQQWNAPSLEQWDAWNRVYRQSWPNIADHKITVGHRSISDQSSCWHGQIELYTVKNVAGHIDDLYRISFNIRLLSNWSTLHVLAVYCVRVEIAIWKSSRSWSWGRLRSDDWDEWLKAVSEWSISSISPCGIELSVQFLYWCWYYHDSACVCPCILVSWPTKSCNDWTNVLPFNKSYFVVWYRQQKS